MTAYDTLREQLSAQPRTWLVTGCAGFTSLAQPYPASRSLTVNASPMFGSL